MIDLARQRVPFGERSRVEFHQIDAVADSLPEGPFDLCRYSFFPRHPGLSRCRSSDPQVTAVLAPGADWLVSEFQEPASGVRRLHASLWLRAMYGFFSAITGLRVSKLPPYRDLLTRSGLSEIDYCERRLGLIDRKSGASTPDPLRSNIKVAWQRNMSSSGKATIMLPALESLWIPSSTHSCEASPLRPSARTSNFSPGRGLRRYRVLPSSPSRHQCLSYLPKREVGRRKTQRDPCQLVCAKDSCALGKRCTRPASREGSISGGCRSQQGLL